MEKLRRNWGIIAVTLGLIVAFLFFYNFSGVFMPYAAGLLFAYLFMPLISWVERKVTYRNKHRQTGRIMLILLIYAIILGITVMFFYYIVTTIIGTFSGIIQNAPGYTSAALLTIQEWISSFRKNIPPEFQAQVDQLLSEIGTSLGNAVRGVFFSGISMIPSSFSFILGFASLPIFLFYLMKDWEKFGKSLYSGLPAGMVDHTRNVISIIGLTVGKYVRNSVLLALILGVFCLTGFLILGVPFALMLALMMVVGDLIPIAGPWLAGTGVVIITLVTAPDKAIWLLVVIVASKAIEDNIFGPKIQGVSLNIHPAIIIVLLAFGTSVAGFWGILFIVPLAATIIQVYKQVYKYVRKVTWAETGK